MKHKYLRQMLEWRMEIDHGWSVKTGVLGKGLKKQLPPEIWAELESTYVGAGIEENWGALFNTIDLFRKVATQVGDDLGYEYPQHLHERVVDYLQRVKRMH
jgi:aminoglycoside 6-adenylyltransferase